MARTHIYRRFAWQAWHSWHWVARLDWLGRALVARDAAALCVAGMALGDIHLHSAWQAWHKYRRFAWQAWDRWHWVARLDWLGRALVARDAAAFCVAGVGAPWSRVTPRHSAWQAWHLVTFTFVSRGRRGTNSLLPSFCVAGVGQMALGGALGLAWARLGRA